MIRVTAFRWVPPFAQGLVRDLRVRWALEEAGSSYVEDLLALGEQSSESHRLRQPFGQVPTYEEDGLVLFESGAIVLHVAERSEALLPANAKDRARVKAWMFSALNTVEPPIQLLALLDHQPGGEAWVEPATKPVIEAIRRHLAVLSGWLERRDYLESGRFTAADLLMTTVLRILRHSALLDEFPVVAAYQRRCEARPAFAAALASQLAPFAENAPPASA